MSRVIARIPQIDGTVRILLAQDERHAAIGREIIRRDRAMIDRLDGVDGIMVTVREVLR